MSKKRLHEFKTFPQFSKLTLADKEAYEDLIVDFPPISDISFASLMYWWNSLDSCQISQLNDNLIISYWLPGDEKHSGLSIVGVKRLDASICSIFDYQREKGEQPRLVHVPEFVIRNLQYPDLFKFKEERGFDEYIIPISRLYPLEGAAIHRRWRIKRFLAQIDDKGLVTKSLNLMDEANQELLLGAAKEWWHKGGINDLLKLEMDALEVSVRHAEELGLENLCIYLDGELQGFCIYQLPPDLEYVIVSHVKINDRVHRMLDFVGFQLAKHFYEQGIRYVNLEYDLGLPMLRMVKLSLGPCNYFRKYTIEPVFS